MSEDYVHLTAIVRAARDCAEAARAWRAASERVSQVQEELRLAEDADREARLAYGEARGRLEDAALTEVQQP